MCHPDCILDICMCDNITTEKKSVPAGVSYVDDENTCDYNDTFSDDEPSGEWVVDRKNGGL